MKYKTNTQANKHFFLFQRRWITAWTSWMVRNGLNLQAVNRGMLAERGRETTKRGRRKTGRDWESNCPRDPTWSAALPPSKVSVCTHCCIFIWFFFFYHLSCHMSPTVQIANVLCFACGLCFRHCCNEKHQERVLVHSGTKQRNQTESQRHTPGRHSCAGKTFYYTVFFLNAMIYCMAFI